MSNIPKRILITGCTNNKSWYLNKVSNRYKVISVTKDGYRVKDGVVLKKDCEVIG